MLKVLLKQACVKVGYLHPDRVNIVLGLKGGIQLNVYAGTQWLNRHITKQPRTMS